MSDAELFPPAVLAKRRPIGAGWAEPEPGTVEWYTPPELMQALGLWFDLDPCAPEGGVPWLTPWVGRTVSLPADGLSEAWEGRVWLNPPYGPETPKWLARLAAHGDGVALVFARTDTEWFHLTVPRASAVCFTRQRIKFCKPDGERTDRAASGSVLFAFGDECARALVRSKLGTVFAINERSDAQGVLWR